MKLFNESARIPLLLFALLVLISGNATGAPKVTRAVAGLDGYLRGDRWVPVVFEISNQGPNFQGVIEVLRGKTIFRKSLDLSSGASKRIEILVYIASYFEQMSYRIIDADERLVKEDKLGPRMLNYQDNLMLVISNNDYNHQFLNGVQNPWGGKTFVAYLKPSELFSEWIAYSAADAIALGSVSMSELDPDQRDGLLLYASSGGTFVMSAATDLSVLQDRSIRQFIPAISAELDRTSTGDFLLSRWTARNTTPFPEFSLPAQTVKPAPSDIVSAELEPGLALITSSSYYKGNIMYFAFNYTHVPEELRLLFAGYFNDTIYPSPAGVPAFGAPFRPRLEDNPRVQRALYNIPGLQLPDIKWFALFFFVYLIAIGPVQYIVLNFFKKNSLVWITFPLMIFLFTAGALGYSKYRHSADRKITQIAVAEKFPAIDREIVYQVYGSAISDSGTFDFQALPEKSYLTKAVRQTISYEFEPFIMSQDLPHKLEDESVKSWTFRTFDAISSRPSEIPVDVDVQMQNGRLHGIVKNQSSYTISESFFLFDRNNTKTIGSLEPGQTKDFSLELNSSSVMPMTENHLRSMLDLYSPSHSSPHFFFAQINNAAGKITINDKQRETDCTIYMAVYTKVKNSGPVSSWLSNTGQPIYPVR